MRAVILAAFVIACREPVPVPLAARASSANPDTLVSEADAFYENWQPDYARPFDGTDLELARAHALELYRRACRLGNHRACWRANDREATLRNCRSGDMTSCHAFQTEAPTPALADVPGWAARAHRHAADHAGSTDNSIDDALRDECSRGLPVSCQSYIDRRRDHVAPRWIRNRLRTVGTAGCDAGLHADCMAVDPAMSGETSAYEQDSVWNEDAGSCNGLLSRIATPDQTRRARDLLERQCQTHRDRAEACAFLGWQYTRHWLPEPVLGRGRQLLEWACHHGEPVACGPLDH